jgi:hypothetical protein
MNPEYALQGNSKQDEQMLHIKPSRGHKIPQDRECMYIPTMAEATSGG